MLWVLRGVCSLTGKSVINNIQTSIHQTGDHRDNEQPDKPTNWTNQQSGG